VILRTRGRDITRLEAFSDGVFALSATLLVVSLEVPRTVPDLMHALSGFAAFALSFGALILIWGVHNGFFRRYGLQDAWTTFLNACLLFVVLFYTYPLKFVASGFARSVFRIDDASGGSRLIGSTREMATLFMLYSGGFVAIFVCVSLLYLHAHRRREALDLDPGEIFEARFYAAHYTIFALVGCLSIAVAATGIGVRAGLPGWIYAMIGPLTWWHGAWSSKRRPSPAHVPEAPEPR
jgi:uncharacterized membrane protein